MLSYNSLGTFGRLGNQMFQYASLKGIARNRGFDFCIPFSPNLNPWQDHQLNHIFKLDKNLIIDSPSQKNTYAERFFHFDYELFNSVEDETDISGYFQTELYFSHIKDEIFEDFSFNKKYELPSGKYTSIHVRRGDYLNFPNHHPLCSLDYYASAKEVTGGPFVVMSDDIQWCKENIQADIYIENTSNDHDLYIMCNAQNNIIANSSFSWWGAWLNKSSDKIVVAPKRWFGDAYAEYNLDDFIPSSWMKI